MDSDLYNSAWESVEFLLFEYIDLKVDLKVRTGFFTEDEGEKLYRENQAVMGAILESFGVTLDELNAETDDLMKGLREKNNG